MRSVINGWGALALTYAVMGLAMSCYLGCGGEAYEQGDATDEAVEVDEPAVELAESAWPITATTFYGWRNDANGIGTACNNTTAQKCVVPNTKNLVYHVGSGCTAGDKSAITADVDAQIPVMNSQFNGWTFSRATQPSWHVDIVCGTISGGAASAAMAYARLSASSLKQLPAPNPPGAGTYFMPKDTPITLTLDMVKLKANYGPADRTRVRRHVLFGGMSGAAGNGFTGRHVNRITSIAVTPTAPKLLTVDACEENKTETYSPAGDFTFVISGC